MITFMEQNLTQPLTTEELSDKSGYSVNRFRQKFFNVTGDTPSGYLRKRRLTEAAKEILSGKRSLDISASPLQNSVRWMPNSNVFSQNSERY
jgi:AraC family transcriptional regulator